VEDVLPFQEGFNRIFFTVDTTADSRVVKPENQLDDRAFKYGVYGETLAAKRYSALCPLFESKLAGRLIRWLTNPVKSGKSQFPPRQKKLAQGDHIMELTEAIVNEAHEEIIEITLTGDEDEWREVAQVLKESDSDLATELGLKIREALRNAGS
jgi:hypothetical protein